MWAQDRIPMITGAVQKSAPRANIAWESHQSYNMTRLLESAAFVGRFDVIVIADVGLGQITPAAQRNLVQFVETGGGLVWGLCGKATIPFQDSPTAVPMPLAGVLPVTYPDFAKPMRKPPSVPVPISCSKGSRGTPWKDQGARTAPGRLALEREGWQGHGVRAGRRV